MASEVHHDVRDGIAVVSLDRPVANALAPSVRRVLQDVITQTVENPLVQAIVLRGAGAGFSSGVDISEYDGALSDPWVSDLCSLIETAPKPVVACLHGAALGAGFELALAAHARVASETTQLALPEVTLGLIPGGGATQRLPRLVGAQAALEFMLSGQIVSATDPRIARVCDRVVDGDPLPVALDLARDLAMRGTWRRARDVDRGFSDPDAYQKTIRTVETQLPNDEGPEIDLVRCVEAAPLLPFARGLEFEQTLFQDRLAAPSARARRHAYTAEKRAGIWPELAQSPTPRLLNTVAILGAGPLVSEVIVALLDGGKEVVLSAPTPDAAETVLAQVVRIYNGAVARKRMQVAQRDERLLRLRRSEPGQAIAEADLVLDTGVDIAPEDMAQRAKDAIWAVMGAGPGVPAALAKRSGVDGALAVRFCRPAHSQRAVEVIAPNMADPAAVAGIVTMTKDLGRIAVRTTDAPVGVSDALRTAIYHVALALAAAGVSPYEIDAAARDLGFVRGPFEMMDAEGLGRVVRRLTEIGKFKTMPQMPRDNVLQARIAAGATGQNAGQGVYLYPADGAATPDPAVLAWCAQQGDDHGWPASDVTPEAAIVSAIANAGASLTQARVVRRASDIDVVAVNGLGFDRRKGGPLLQADMQGMLQVLKTLQRLEPLDPDIWRPHPVIVDMVKNGQGFFGQSV